MPPKHFRRRPPPWWPTNEAWPPISTRNRQYWHNLRGRFIRRIGCLFLLLILLAFAGFTALFWLIAGASGIVYLSESVLMVMRTVGILGVLFGLPMIFFAGRELTRTAMPIGDMLDAAGQIAEGDYSTRVDERGPREVRALARAFNTMTARLQAEDEQRRNLLAEITHELRTPITVIQGNLEGLLDEIYPADHAHIESILEETRVLSRVIDDLRTLSYADSGALKLQLESTRLEDLVGEAVASYRPQAGTSGVVLRVDVEPGLPPVEIDSTRIREVLSNLLANALRYTPPAGQIDIRCWFETGQPDHLNVSISDTGAGISAQDLPHIFDRFYKTGDSHGSGLGLAIAKSLIAAHGGEISAQSEPGRGTQITFSLPTSPQI
jgi:signal transduction histidine kinase